jgi:hypothetical protein
MRKGIAVLMADRTRLAVTLAAIASRAYVMM